MKERFLHRHVMQCLKFFHFFSCPGQGGFDQAFVTPDTNGKLTESALLIDDDFALALVARRWEIGRFSWIQWITMD